MNQMSMLIASFSRQAMRTSERRSRRLMSSSGDGSQKVSAQVSATQYRRSSDTGSSSATLRPRAVLAFSSASPAESSRSASSCGSGPCFSGSAASPPITPDSRLCVSAGSYSPAGVNEARCAALRVRVSVGLIGAAYPSWANASGSGGPAAGAGAGAYGSTVPWSASSSSTAALRRLYCSSSASCARSSSSSSRNTMCERNTL